MAKAKKIQYGIEITKPWSKAMYAHNDKVADQVRNILNEKLQSFRDKLDPLTESQLDDELQQFGKWVVGYGGWIAYTNIWIMDEIEREIHNAPYYRLNEIVEDLDIELEEGFVGFN